MNHLSHRFMGNKSPENYYPRIMGNKATSKPFPLAQGRPPLFNPKTSARPHRASPAAAEAPPGCSWRSASLGDSHRGALRSLQDLGGAGPPPGISEMPEMSYFHSACAYICYRPHLHSFAGIHPKDLTVLPYFHFANYNYEMWMEVPTMYYAQKR